MPRQIHRAPTPRKRDSRRARTTSAQRADMFSYALGDASAGSGDSNTHSAKDAQKLVGRALMYEDDTPSMAYHNAVGLFEPATDDLGSGHGSGYADVKKQDMDTKMPPLLADEVAEFSGRSTATSASRRPSSPRSPSRSERRLTS